MIIRTEQEDRLVRYILGRLEAEQESQIEEQFFADDQFFEQLLAVEDAMMDAYAQGELPEDEREEFKEYLTSSPRRMRDLGFTRNLIGDAAKMRADRKPSGTDLLDGQSFLPRQPGSSFLTSWYALVTFLLIGGLGVYLAVSYSNLRKQIQQLEAELVAWENGNRDPGQVPGNKNASRLQQADVVASLVLSSANLSRGGGAMPSVGLKQQVGQLRIQIEVPNEASRIGYLVTCATTRGDEVWKGMVLPDQVESGKLDVFILVGKLKNDVYTLKLERLTEDNQLAYVGEYAFRVKR